MVNHSVWPLANLFEPGPSTKLTVLGAVPWAMTESGFSLPVVKIGTILSKYLIFLTFIAWRLPPGKTFLHIQYSISPISNEFGWVTTRCTTASESSAVICSVMPRSALHFSAISLIADTPVPHWRSTIFLLFCAQIVGKPPSAPLPIAAPARPAVPFSILRRPTPFLMLPAISCSSFTVRGRARPRVSTTEPPVRRAVRVRHRSAPPAPPPTKAPAPPPRSRPGRSTPDTPPNGPRRKSTRHPARQTRPAGRSVSPSPDRPGWRRTPPRPSPAPPQPAGHCDRR